MAGPIPVPTGRFVREFESSEMRSKWMTQSVPSAVTAMIVGLAVFFGVVFGTTLIYEGYELLGAVLCSIAVIAVVAFVVS